MRTRTSDTVSNLLIALRAPSLRRYARCSGDPPFIILLMTQHASLCTLNSPYNYKVDWFVYSCLQVLELFDAAYIVNVVENSGDEIGIDDGLDLLEVASGNVAQHPTTFFNDGRPIRV